MRELLCNIGSTPTNNFPIRDSYESAEKDGVLIAVAYSMSRFRVDISADAHAIAVETVTVVKLWSGWRRQKIFAGINTAEIGMQHLCMGVADVQLHGLPGDPSLDSFSWR